MSMKRLFLVLAVPMLSAVGLSAEEPVSEEKVDAATSGEVRTWVMRVFSPEPESVTRASPSEHGVHRVLTRMRQRRWTSLLATDGTD